MTIKKPNVKHDLLWVYDMLPLVYEAKHDDTDVTQLHFKEVLLTNEDLSNITFRNCIFENCRFLDCIVPKSSFIDVFFKSCDLSNSIFSDGFFQRCEFNSCKLMGANFNNCNFNHASIHHSNCKYTNFDKSNLNFVSILGSDFSDANMAECTLKSIALCEARFYRTNFFQTPLKGLNFTTSEIDGIILSSYHNELNGAIVNVYQANDLAKILGVIII